MRKKIGKMFGYEKVLLSTLLGYLREVTCTGLLMGFDCCLCACFGMGLGKQLCYSAVYTGANVC